MKHPASFGLETDLAGSAAICGAFAAIMKNSLLSTTEVESLRAQVRELCQSVAELEDRLADFETETSTDENPWGIWPYCYFVSAWNFGRGQVHGFHKKLNRWNLSRRNRRFRLQNDAPIGEMRLT